MQYLFDGLTYLARNFFRRASGAPAIYQLLLEHLQMTVITLGVGLLIAVPLAVLLARVRLLRGPVLAVLGVIYTIPSLALFVLLIALFGLGQRSALIGLVAYAQLVLVRNTLVGLTGVDPAIIEAARGMGMSGWQRFWRVEFPLALPLIVAGVRLAALSTIGIATIAAYINAGGLGNLLFIGLSTGNRRQIVAGSIAIAALAIVINGLLRLVEYRSARALHGDG